jgi:hypothetical protein
MFRLAVHFMQPAFNGSDTLHSHDYAHDRDFAGIYIGRT